MGFLGYLHVGITVDRLRQEYGSEVLFFRQLSNMKRLL
jgi:translation elongation factor EF-4